LVCGVVDENIDTAELPRGAVDDCAAMVCGAQVAFDEEGLASLLLDERRDFLRILGFFEIGNQDVRCRRP
jgi:hypothetical protein